MWLQGERRRHKSLKVIWVRGYCKTNAQDLESSSENLKPSNQSVLRFTLILLYMMKENLAAPQVTYNRFHTTAICSPTRASLLLGYDEHLGKWCSPNGGVSYTYRGMCQKYFRAKVLSGIIQCKCMVNLRDFHLIVHGLGWSYSDPYLLQSIVQFLFTPWSCEYSR